MADAPDIYLGVMSQIWDALVSLQKWKDAYPEPNRIRYDTVDGDDDPGRQSNRTDVDFPNVELRLRSCESGLQTSDVTFGTHSSSGCPNFTEKFRAVYRLVYKSQLHNASELTEAVVLTLQAIRQSGPRLGLSYVNTIKVRAEISKPEEDPTESTRREVALVDIYVEGESNSKTLNGE